MHRSRHQHDKKISSFILLICVSRSYVYLISISQAMDAPPIYFTGADEYIGATYIMTRLCLKSYFVYGFVSSQHHPIDTHRQDLFLYGQRLLDLIYLSFPKSARYIILCPILCTNVIGKCQKYKLCVFPDFSDFFTSRCLSKLQR